ncbi:MAG: diaminopimelate epimerase [Rickettsiales bacterium]|nr:diaminopimelate epimerase [Rickettsiales bacterium]
MKTPFTKMSGIGNDFIIFDARNREINLSKAEIEKFCDRKNIGCDQLILIKKSVSANCLMEIYNADGSTSSACGNATRCVSSIIFDEESVNNIAIETAAGILKCYKISDKLIAVDIAIPTFDWQKIPLLEEIDSQKIYLHGFAFSTVNVGNPHAVTFVSEIPNDDVFFDVAPKICFDKIFPKQANIEFAKIISDDLIEVRVFERGAGETLACGTGACAVAILAMKHNLVKNNKITIRFKGGDLLIEWHGKNSYVTMTGGYEKIFDGIVEIAN